MKKTFQKHPARRSLSPYLSWRHVIFFALALLCIILGSSAGRAETALLSASEVDYPPFCIVDADGSAHGFSVELLRAALAAMNCEVNFRTGPWSDVRGRLERGEVQALPLVGRTPERESLFDFTFPYMSLHGAIVVRKGEAGINTLEDLRGRRVAVMKGDNAEEFLRRKERGINIHTTGTFEDALRELSAGHYDAVVIQRLVALRLIQEAGYKNLRVVDRPIEDFQQDFCFAVKEGDRETLALLNEGLAIVIADGTYRHLYAKWFAALQLPLDRPIIIAGDYNYPPFEFLDEKGRPAGFTVELTRAIAREMNMDIRIRLGPWANMVDSLMRGEIDAIQGMFYSPERDSALDFSQPYLVSHYVSVVRQDTGKPPETLEELEGRSLVVQEGDIILDFLVEHGLGALVSVAETQEDVLRAVSEGDHDCALVVRVSAMYFIENEKNKLKNLVFGSNSFFSGEYCYAVPNNQKALLAQFTEGLKILEKSGEYRRIHEKWMGVYEQEPIILLTALRYSAMLIGPLVLIILIGFLWVWSLRREVASRTEALRESTELQRAMIVCSPVALFSIDLEGNVLEWNTSAERVFGWTTEEVMGRPLPIVPDDKQTEFEAYRRHLMQGGELYGEEVLRRKKDGSLFYGSLFEAPIKDAQGNIVGIMASIEDITERKRSEENLRRSEALLNAAQRISRIGGWEWDVDNREMFWTEETYRIYDFDFNEVRCEGQELIDRSIACYEEGAREEILGAFQRCMNEGRAYELECRFTTAKGRHLWIRTAGRAIYEGGRIVKVIGNIQDITERKIAEKRMAHLNQVLRSVRDVNQLIVHERDRNELIRKGCHLLVDNRSHGNVLIILTDESDRPVSWADAGLEKNRERMNDMLQSGTLPPCCKYAGNRGKTVLIEDQSSLCAECPVTGDCAETDVMCVRLISVDTPYGYITATLSHGLGADTEERELFTEMAEDIAYAMRVIQSEEARRKSEQDRVDMEAQLQQAQRMESIGRLAGGVAHDFNNMLSVIMGCSELAMLKVDPKDPIYADLSEILKAANRSADITRQLLAFARKQTISPKILDFNETVESMMKMLRRFIGEDIELVWIPGGGLWSVKIDPAQVDQILANLCVNARDAISGVGKVTIETNNVILDEAYCEDHVGFIPGKFILLTFSDNGCGMDEETRDNIFEPFFTTKDVSRGTGLGLSTVYGIVKQNNGFINVYSESGKGTTFKIYLPYHEGKVEMDAEEAMEIPEARGETVMIVEDELSILNLIRRLLESLGYSVLTAITPDEALDLGREHAGDIDLLITDTIMPEMNGRELAERLRSIRPDLKVIFMSGYTANVIVNHGVLEDGVHFIQKPFSKRELAVKVREILEGK